ncbi:Radical SAM superfamily enzyme, MoaA/NifB/PqqE/SkfB family [Pseudobutyrivibrio sp. ACV-2]|uniref:radical SAM protein n=1 Tax=Pseudobutyrivibrio sp. ACV-2 TaxID=1520801 RepID=UPI000896EC67|nr:radical SAM protein [Pseudobutyrivibrio sp. ACV-2]SEA10670.1 Radical SAM superfamily enzyme, MoaA/NifB/PqqE/SkfB family [Pseudobutyrivibrio sp. ACV-2]
MKYAIYGVNRVSKDFLYIFDNLEIVCFFDDEYVESRFLGAPVYSSKDIIPHKGEFNKLIVCDFDKKDKIKVLNELGLSSCDYTAEDTFFEQLNSDRINSNNKPILIWGTGIAAGKLLEWDKTIKPQCYVDTYKYGKKFNEVEILKPDIDLCSKHFIIVAIRKNQEIIQQLQQWGFKHWEDYCTDEEYIALPSELLKRTIFDKSCYDLGCRTMLNHMEVGTDGNSICCCSTFIYHSLGSLLNKSAGELWSSSIHKIMCLSNVNKTYSFCRKDMCPFFIGTYNKAGTDLSSPYKKMEASPTTVAVGFDETCNLKCITCRDSYKVACEEEQEKLDIISNKIKEELLPDCEFYISAGNGETLMSKQYRNLLTCKANKDTKWIRLLSNGLLFNEKNWRMLRETTSAKIMITISIDAATKSTYEAIRRGGNFDILKKNMEYAASLRKNGELSYMRLNFVVQAMNYKEMPGFVKWGLELGVDEVFFTKILNWGTYSEEEFAQVSMMESDGVTPKKELKEILSLPIMQEKIVDLGTIQYGRMNVEKGSKENYYRWELERKVTGLFE